MTDSASADVFIIGGGPAGLSAALTLARQRRSAVVFDSGKYRNARATKLHMVPGWDNKAPEDFRKAMREDISRYPNIRLMDTEINYVTTNKGGQIMLIDSSFRMWTGKKLILATGSAVMYPKLDGYEDNWAISIFDCLLYHDFEDDGDDRPSGVLAIDRCADPATAIRLSESAAQFSSSVTIYTNGSENLGLQIVAASGRGKKPNIDPRSIRSIRHGSIGAGVVLHFEDGSDTTEAFLLHTPITHTNGPFAEALGLELSATGEIKCEAPFYQTSMRGIFAAGDCVTSYKFVPGAISSGCSAAFAASEQLQAEASGRHSIVETAEKLASDVR